MTPIKMAIVIVTDCAAAGAAELLALEFAPLLEDDEAVFLADESPEDLVGFSSSSKKKSWSLTSNPPGVVERERSAPRLSLPEPRVVYQTRFSQKHAALPRREQQLARQVPENSERS
jgi:hypothetical protein